LCTPPQTSQDGADGFSVFHAIDDAASSMAALISAAAAVTGSDTNLNTSLHGSAVRAALRKSASAMADPVRSTSRFPKGPKGCIGEHMIGL
jgi:hypothetical protein